MNTSDRALKLRFFVVSPVTKLLPSPEGFCLQGFSQGVAADRLCLRPLFPIAARSTGSAEDLCPSPQKRLRHEFRRNGLGALRA